LEYAQKQQETDGINQTIQINPSGKDKKNRSIKND